MSDNEHAGALLATTRGVGALLSAVCMCLIEGGTDVECLKCAVHAIDRAEFWIALETMSKHLHGAIGKELSESIQDAINKPQFHVVKETEETAIDADFEP